MRKKLVFIAIILSIILVIISYGKSDNKNDVFPSKNIKIIVPYGAGGGVDITTRLFVGAGKNNSLLKEQSFIVENISGGGGAVGHTNAYKAEPDGYTIIAYTNAVVNNPILKDVIYNKDDFKTLAMVCFDPEILVVPPNSKFNNLDEFIEYAKNNDIKISTPGHSTSHHIAASLLAKEQKLKFKYLHNDGASVQLQQLMGGHCDAAFMSVGETVSQLRDGSIKALGVMNENRIHIIDDIPTFKERDIELVYGAYRGYGCSKDVPEEEYKLLRELFEEIASSDEFIKIMEDTGIPYCFKNSIDFQNYVEDASKEIEDIKFLLRDNK
ncbi:tripartite tricarboxylate transporter substrate binding protein [Tissierella praeacuta]|uniref:tripartite tricarboxylate transporter substrate binding protein n=1 Tax=Tissierella praeacuta TaxID=43131 RepID=UPI00333E9031